MKQAEPSGKSLKSKVEFEGELNGSSEGKKSTGEEVNDRAQPLVFCNKDSRPFLVSPAP